MTQPQTLAVGQPLPSRYGRLGGRVGQFLAPLARSVAFFFSLPKEGKSTLLQSNPDAFIFNTDGSSTTANPCLATIWPAVDPVSGQPLGDDGLPFVLTWERCMEKIAILKELAARNEPRPVTVTFDSLATWTRLVIDYVTRNATNLSLRSAEKGAATAFRQLDGKAAWDVVYDTIVSTVMDLKAAGYGVHVAGHMTRKYIPLGEEAFVQECAFTFGDGFWRRFFPLLELSAAIVSADVPVPVERQIKSNIRGIEKTEIKKEIQNVRKHYLTVTDDKLRGMTGARVRFQPIELPASHGWAAFEAAYAAAQSPPKV